MPTIDRLNRTCARVEELWAIDGGHLPYAFQAWWTNEEPVEEPHIVRFRLGVSTKESFAAHAAALAATVADYLVCVAPADLELLTDEQVTNRNGTHPARRPCVLITYYERSDRVAVAVVGIPVDDGLEWTALELVDGQMRTVLDAFKRQ